MDYDYLHTFVFEKWTDTYFKNASSIKAKICIDDAGSVSFSAVLGTEYFKSLDRDRNNTM